VNAVVGADGQHRISESGEMVKISVCVHECVR